MLMTIRLACPEGVAMDVSMAGSWVYLVVESSEKVVYSLLMSTPIKVSDMNNV